MTVFTCDDEFDAMMTCIYDAWASGLGHDNVRLKVQPLGNLELFCQYQFVDKDPDKTLSVIRSIQKKISFRAYIMVYRAAMSCDEDKLDAIYRFLVAGFHYGPSILDYLQEPVVHKIFELNRKIGNEAHYFKEFVRFVGMDDHVLVSHISPKSNVLTMIAPHFADRLPSENWMIIDDKRDIAVVHPSNRDFYLTALTHDEMIKLSKQTDDPFIDLWRGFFQNIGIKERKNPRCQRNMMPLWYRKNAPEFQDHDQDQHQSS